MVLECLCIPAHLMELATRIVEDVGQGKGMAQLSSQGKRLLAAAQGLIGITKAPQTASRIGHGAGARIGPAKGYEGAMVLSRIVEGKHLLDVGQGCGVFSESEQDKAQVPGSQHDEHRVFGLLGQAERLFCELTRPLMLDSHIVKYRQPTQYLTELRRFPRLLAQFAGPDVGSFRFRTIARGALPRCAEGQLQSKFLLSVFQALLRPAPQPPTSFVSLDGSARRIGRAMR